MKRLFFFFFFYIISETHTQHQLTFQMKDTLSKVWKGFCEKCPNLGIKYKICMMRAFRDPDGKHKCGGVKQAIHSETVII